MSAALPAFDVIIPARYASTRLPGKPLLDIAGMTLIERVYRCAQSSGAEQIIVATDDARIAREVLRFGGQACMTAGAHRSGTDRVAEAIERLNIAPDRVIVNVQGDEAQMPGALIDQVAQCLVAHPEAQLATACEPIGDDDAYRDPSIVKVVCDDLGYALYFSRAPIPWERDRPPADGSERVGAPRRAARHIGIYAYRAGYVTAFAARPPGELEGIEQLEQLRALAQGEKIAVCAACERPGPGVDTPADLDAARRLFARGAER